ncbi:beta/alpha barrel domain-containing protein [Paraburkholderia phenoliruptrix]|nr:hypothetical protein [Paraburkholderia phenoliruptrix]
MMSTNEVSTTKILDCTLRDGGYYTGWEFSAEMVSDYVGIINTLPVRMVELGFAGKPDASGYFASLTNSKAQQAIDGLVAEACVMIDAKDVFGSAMPIADAVSSVTDGLEPGEITTVRLAAHYKTTGACKDICAELSRKGFRVFLNLMQIDAATPAEFEACIREVQQITTIDVLYIADSFGSMTPKRVREFVARFKDQSAPEVGFHGHDNRGWALANSMIAASAGATWIDCTMGGMGRGAGNAASERIIPILAELEASKEQPLLNHVIRHFDPLRERYRWGCSAAYQFAGSNLIHPSYVQALRESGELSEAGIIACLSDLGRDERMSFSDEKLRTMKAQLIN